MNKTPERGPSVVITLAFLFLTLFTLPAFAGGYGTGAVSATITTENVTILGLCVYGNGSDEATVYCTDNANVRKSDTVRVAATYYGPYCVSYGTEGGIQSSGLKIVVGGTPDHFGVTYVPL